MYRFPHPFTLDPAGIGRCRLILPEEWSLADPDLVQVGTLARTIFATSLDGYSVYLDGKTKPAKHGSPRADAGTLRRFNVFEHR